MAYLSVAKIVSRRSPLVRISLTIASFRSMAQAKRMPGFLAGVAGPDKGGVFFAVSLWATEDHLAAYARSGAHGKAAKKINKWAKAHVSGHKEADAIPGTAAWSDVLRDRGKIIRLPAGQDMPDGGLYAGPRTTMGRALRLKPKAGT